MRSERTRRDLHDTMGDHAAMVSIQNDVAHPDGRRRHGLDRDPFALSDRRIHASAGGPKAGAVAAFENGNDHVGKETSASECMLFDP